MTMPPPSAPAPKRPAQSSNDDVWDTPATVVSTAPPPPVHPLAAQKRHSTVPAATDDWDIDASSNSTAKRAKTTDNGILFYSILHLILYCALA